MTRHPFHVTKHAVERALDMAVDGEEIGRAVLTPQRITPNPQGGEFRAHGRIVVAYLPATGTVTTVFWRYQSSRATDMHRGADYGRTAQHEPHLDYRRKLRQQKTRAPKAFDGGRRNARRPREEDEEW